MTFGILASAHVPFVAGWTALALTNSWDNYGGTYADAAFYQVGDVTYSRGLVDSGTTTAGTAMAAGQMPTPSGTLVFPEAIATTPAAFGAVDVQADGDLVTRAADSTWTTLSRIVYADSDTSMTAPTLVNSWANYGSGFESAGHAKDSDGNVVVQGVVSSGTTTKGTTIFTLPSGSRPTGGSEIFPVVVSGDTYGAVDVTGAGNVVTRSVSGTWTSLCGINFNADVSWTAPTLLNSWANYGGVWCEAGYAKDASGVVHLRGLIASGGTSNGTDIFILPSGYRPAEDIIAVVPFVATADTDKGQIFIRSNGTVEVRYGLGNTFLSLSGISFIAA